MKRSTSFTGSVWIILISVLLLGDLVIVYSQPKTQKKFSEDLLHTIRKDFGPSRAFPHKVMPGKDPTLKGAEQGMTLIEVLSDGNTDQLLADLKNLGLKNAVAYGKVINGYLPVSALNQLESLKNLVFAGPVYKPLLNSGKAYTNGDIALKANVIRSSRGLDGKGIKIGVLSDSYNHYKGASEGVLSGELPGKGNPNGYTTDWIRYYPLLPLIWTILLPRNSTRGTIKKPVLV